MVRSSAHGDRGEAQAAAEAGLDLVPELVAEVHVADPSSLRLGEAVAARSVAPDQLDQLDGLDPVADLDDILEPEEVITYPVLDGDEIVSSITVAPDPGGQWTVQAVGSPNQMRVVAELRDHDASETGTDPSDYFLVAVPTLRTTLLGRWGPRGAQLSHLYTNERLGYRASRWARAGELLGEAAKATKRADEEG